MLRVYTSMEINKIQNVKVKKGEETFAPSKKTIKDYREGKIDREEYSRLYKEKMKESYKKEREEWDELLSRPWTILTCPCPKDSFCHRYMLAEFLVELGAIYEGEL